MFEINCASFKDIIQLELLLLTACVGIIGSVNQLDSYLAVLQNISVGYQ